MSNTKSTKAESMRKDGRSAYHAAVAIKEFTEENFRGLAEVTVISADKNLLIKISDAELANIFKMIYKYADYDCFLSVEISSSASSLNFLITKSPKRQFSSELSEKISTYAKVTGISIHFDGMSIKIRADGVAKKKNTFAVYAEGIEEIKSIFYKTFFS